MFESLSWAQIEPGVLEMDRTVLDDAPLKVASRSISVGVKVEAQLKPHGAIVGLIADSCTRARWFGARVDRRAIVASSSCIDVRTIGPSHFYEIGIDLAALAKRFPTAPDADTIAQNLDGAHLVRDNARVERLRTGICRILSLGSPRRVAGRMLIPLIAEALETFDGRSIEPSKSLRRRLSAVRTCESYLRQHADSAVTLLDLSAIAGMRSRSLINAFEAVTGFSPMDYLKRLRLNGVHRALQQADKARTKIIDVASAWGFWHMGHFAADYRAMFGEAPSRTLLK